MARLCDTVKEAETWSETAASQGAQQVGEALRYERVAIAALEKVVDMMNS